MNACNANYAKIIEEGIKKAWTKKYKKLGKINKKVTKLLKK